MFFLSTKMRFISQKTSIFAAALSLALATTGPVEAGVINRIQSIISGNTGSEVQGSSRGGATRDESCTVNPVSGEISPSGSWQMSSLLPKTAYQTTLSEPSLFVYLQYTPSEDISSVTTSVKSLGIKQEVKSLKLENITANDLPQFDTQTNINLSLQLELTRNNNNEVLKSYNIALPTGNSLVQLPLTDETFPLVINQSYEWTVRLLCQKKSAQDVTEIAIEQSALFGTVTRVPMPNELHLALDTNKVDDRYQTYIDNELWLELISDLAEVPTSTDWHDLLENFQISPTDTELKKYVIPTGEVTMN